MTNTPDPHTGHPASDAGRPATDTPDPHTGHPASDAGRPATDTPDEDAGRPATDTPDEDAGRPATDAPERDAGHLDAPGLDGARPDAPDPDAGHPANGLDEVVHQRVRLGILTIAHEARRVEFGYLRTQLELTAGNLSKHLSVLETAGLIAVEKGYEGRRARTWIALTPAGTTALADEIGRLKQLIARVDTSGPG